MFALNIRPNICKFITDMFRTSRVFIAVFGAGFALLAALLFVGCSGDSSPDGFGAPEFLSVSAKADGNSVYLTCSYKGRGAGICGFALAKGGAVVKRMEAETRSDGSFSLNVKDLEYDTEYVYYAWISNGSAEIHSNTGTVHTEQKPVVVPDIVGLSFQADENVLTLNCTFTGEEVEGCGFYFNGSDKMAADNRGEGNFSLTLRNLDYDKEYEFQAYITSGEVEVKSSVEKAKTGKMASIPISDAAFKSYVLGLYDSDKNGKLSMEEAEKITHLDINTYDLKIQSFGGIEFFTNLEYLRAVGYGAAQRGEVTRLDLSRNTKLNTLYCSFNKLDFLDLGGNASLRYVDCSSNFLHNVNSSDHRPDFSALSGLEYLDCHSNDGLVVFLGNHPSLKYLDCNHTEGYDYVGLCTAIEYIDCSSCSSMMYLNVSGLKNLSTLKFEDNGQINEFDATGCENLEFGESIFKGNTFSYVFKAGGCSKMTSLEFESANNLITVDVSGCTMLKSVKCNGIDLEQINLGGCVSLTEIECYDNYLHELDVSSCKKLSLKAWPQSTNFDKLWIGSGEYHFYDSSGAEVNPADYGTEVTVRE